MIEDARTEFCIQVILRCVAPFLSRTDDSEPWMDDADYGVISHEYSSIFEDLCNLLECAGLFEGFYAPNDDREAKGFQPPYYRARFPLQRAERFLRALPLPPTIKVGFCLRVWMDVLAWDGESPECHHDMMGHLEALGFVRRTEKPYGVYNEWHPLVIYSYFIRDRVRTLMDDHNQLRLDLGIQV